MDAVSYTDQWTAAISATESDFGEQRLFEDNLAGELAKRADIRSSARLALHPSLSLAETDPEHPSLAQGSSFVQICHIRLFAPERRQPYCRFEEQRPVM